MWKLNDPLIDENGRPARLITQPIPGRAPAVAVIQYPDGRARQVDIARCKPPPPEDKAAGVDKNI